MNGKKIIITGGTGYLGRFLIQKYYPDNEVTVFSRDESKQAFLKREFPKLRCVIGDIRDARMLDAAVAGHDFGIFAASMKHVSAVNENVSEAEQIIVQGAINARESSTKHDLTAAVFVSTDKSRFPTTIYGGMKFVAGELFIWDAEKIRTRLSTTVCGNIINSTGSVIPMIWNAIKTKTRLKLYSETISRFTITGEETANLVDFSLNFVGVNVVPKLRSFMVKDLFDVYAEKFGLDYVLDVPENSVEREAELLISKDDIPRTQDVGDYYLIHHKKKSPKQASLVNDEYSSRDSLMTKYELNDMLEKQDYYRQ